MRVLSDDGWDDPPRHLTGFQVQQAETNVAPVPVAHRPPSAQSSFQGFGNTNPARIFNVVSQSASSNDKLSEESRHSVSSGPHSAFGGFKRLYNGGNGGQPKNATNHPANGAQIREISISLSSHGDSAADGAHHTNGRSQRIDYSELDDDDYLLTGKRRTPEIPFPGYSQESDQEDAKPALTNSQHAIPQDSDTSGKGFGFSFKQNNFAKREEAMTVDEFRRTYQVDAARLSSKSGSSKDSNSFHSMEDLNEALDSPGSRTVAPSFVKAENDQIRYYSGTSDSTSTSTVSTAPSRAGGLGFGKPSNATTLGPRLLDPRGGKPSSSYVPKKDKIDELYKMKITPGVHFNKFFDAATEVTKCSLSVVTSHNTYFRSFDDIHLTELIRNNILQRCEYKRPTPVQQCTATRIINGEDMLVCAQTGCGKTAAFLLPIFSNLLSVVDVATYKDRACFPRCVIVAPTRELATQIYKEGRKFAYGSALEVRCIYGGTCVAFQKKEIMEVLYMPIGNGCGFQRTTVLVATTGRLRHFLDDGTVSLERVKTIVIDEADRMLDMGFGPDIEAIMSHETISSRHQTLMFSATFPTTVQKIAQKHLAPDYAMITVDKIGIANKCIKQTVMQTMRSEKKNLLFKLLDIDLETYTTSADNEIFKQKTMIFVARKTFADALGIMLCEANIPSTTIHSDRGQEEREEALRDFQYGRKAILVATGVAERGLDICGVDHVISYDMPADIDTYIHRIGRTGRVGNPGRATSFFCDMDVHLAQDLARVLKEADQEVPDFLEHYDYASAPSDPVSEEEAW